MKKYIIEVSEQEMVELKITKHRLQCHSISRAVVEMMDRLRDYEEHIERQAKQIREKDQQIDKLLSKL